MPLIISDSTVVFLPPGLVRVTPPAAAGQAGGVVVSLLELRKVIRITCLSNSVKYKNIFVKLEAAGYYAENGSFIITLRLCFYGFRVKTS
jgi:hypothetical protein